MKKNFILFALMLFLPILAFAQNVTLAFTTSNNSATATPVIYKGSAYGLAFTRGGQDQNWSRATGNGTNLSSNGQYRIYKGTPTFNWWDPTTPNGTYTQVSQIVDAGTYTIRIRRNNNDYLTGTVTVNARNIESDDVTINLDAPTYTGSALTPDFTVTDAGVPEAKQNLTTDDYTVTQWTDNTDAGYETASVKITGKGNYTGAKTFNFSINPVVVYSGGLSASFSDPASPAPYTGSVIEPTVTVTYSLSYQPDLSGRRAPAINSDVVTFGSDDFAEITWTKGGVAASLQESGIYTPVITFKNNSNFVFEDESDEPTGGDQQNLFTWASDDEFTVAPLDITSAVLDVTYDETLTYNGLAQDPSTSTVIPFVVKDPNGNTMTLGTDFEVTRIGTGFTNIGEYAFSITGKGEKYTGTNQGVYNYSIVKRYLKISPAQVTKIYGADDPEPNFTEEGLDKLAKPEDRAHVLSYLVFNRATVNGQVDNGENVGDHQYFISLKDDMTGCNYDIDIQMTNSILLIKKKQITVHVAQRYKNFGVTDDPDFTADRPIANQPTDYFWIKDADGNVLTTNAANPANAKNYIDKATGEPLRGLLGITRTAGEVVTENGYPFSSSNKNYDVTFDAPFMILPIGASVDNIADLVYNGKAQTPVIVKDGDKTLKENVDYTITYSNNVNAGTASYTVNYQGNYSGTKSGTFKIKKAPMHITAKSYSKTLGYEFNENDVEILFKTSDFVNGETQAVFTNDANYVKPKTQLAQVTDPKKIKIEFVKVNNQYGNSTNYEFIPSDVEGFLYIGRPVLFITARAKKVYGAADPDLSKLPLLTDEELESDKDGIIVDGWVKNESQAAKESFLKINGTSYFFEMERQEGEDAGYYDIDFEGPTSVGQEGDGYEIQYVDGTFTITTAPLTIYAQAAEKFYGEDDPEPWPIVAEGLKNGDTVEDLQYGTRTFWWFSQTEPTYTVTRESGENVGKYTVTNIQPSDYAQYNETLQNYTVTWKVAKESTAANAQNVKLTIKPIDIVIKVADAQITYGQEYVPNIEVESPTNLGRRTNAAIIAAIKDAKDTAGKALLKYSGIPTETPINAGEYTISAEGPATVTNYAITAYNPGKLTVAQYALTSVKANDQGIAYAGTFNPYYLTINGVNYEDRANETMTPAGDLTLPTGDKLSDVLALESTITKVGANKNAYTLNTNKAKSANYSFPELTNGYLTISALEYIPLGETALAALLGKPATEWPLSQVLKDHDGVTTDVKLADRGMFYDQWYGLVLPFDTKVSALSKKLDYAVVNTLNPNNDGYANGFNFEIAMGELPANTPFLVKVADENKKKADVAEITFEKVEIVYAEEPKATDKSGDFQIVGTWDSFVGPEGNCIVIRNSSKGPRTETFDNATADTKVRETEAYLRLPEGANPANVRILVQEADGTMTAINGVAEAEAEVAEGWYTINGVKLEGEPTVSGTYIFNGKKVFIQK